MALTRSINNTVLEALIAWFRPGEDETDLSRMWVADLLSEAGVTDVEALDNGYGFQLLASGLRSANENPATIERLLLLYVDPTKYAGHAGRLTHVLTSLNNILILDGIQIRITGVTPRIDIVEPALYTALPEFAQPDSKPRPTTNALDYAQRKSLHWRSFLLGFILGL